MSLKIDGIYKTTVIGLENDAKGVCKINGIIVFVPKVLVSEEIIVRITEIKKNFAVGKLVKILKSSDKRIKSNCPYYNECGGCDLRHQDINENINFKKEKVKTALKRIGKIDKNLDFVITSIKNDNYRNKVSFKVENNRIGFYAQGSYQLIDIDYCLLAEDEINKALKIIRKYLSCNKNEIKTVTIKHGNACDELLIDIFSSDNNDIKITSYLMDNISNLKTIIFNEKVIYGNGYINQILNGLMFNCSSKSFFQVNSMQVEKLYKKAIELAEFNKDDVVLDLYCGTGTITSLVSSYVKEVIGIEIVEDAIIDAKENLRINRINNVKFICADVTKQISKINKKIDVVIIDPPRKGLDRKAIAVIKKISPKKIIYISCNPVTMARDLNYLNDKYLVNKVGLVDMFPNTSHVECICVLNLR